MTPPVRAVVLAVAALWPGAALAQSWCVPSERDRVEASAQRLEQQDFEGAEGGLLRAYNACPDDPRIAGMLGIAQVGTQRYVEAERHLVATLAYALQRRDDPQRQAHRAYYRWIEGARQGLEQDLAVARAHLGSIVVQAPVPGAVLTLPDERRVVLPMAEPVRVQAGAFVISIEARGHLPARLDVEVAAGQVTRVDATLTREPPPPPVPPPPPPPPPVVVQRLHHPSPLRTVGWVSVGLGAASLVTAAIAWGYTESLQSQTRHASAAATGEFAAWFDYWVERGRPADAARLCDDARRGLGDVGDASQVSALCERNETMRVLTGVFLGVGSAALVTGVALVALARDRVEERRLTPRVSASLGVHGGEVSVSVPFF